MVMTEPSVANVIGDLEAAGAIVADVDDRPIQINAPAAGDEDLKRAAAERKNAALDGGGSNG
jgi:hypothetical protein